MADRLSGGLMDAVSWCLHLCLVLECGQALDSLLTNRTWQRWWAISALLMSCYVRLSC